MFAFLMRINMSQLSRESFSGENIRKLLRALPNGKRLLYEDAHTREIPQSSTCAQVGEAVGRRRLLCLSATRRRTSAAGWEKLGCARKRDTMLPRMIAPSGEVRRTEAARVELCVCELRGNRTRVEEGGGGDCCY